MQRVVLDTNIIVSAILSDDSKPYQIVNMALDEKFIVYYSPEMLTEYEDVLGRDKLHLDSCHVKDVLDSIKAVGILVSHIVSDEPLPDEDDRVFYDVAMANDAILITGNRKHFPKKDFILSPSEFFDAHIKGQ